jgi:hypothetical protein
MKSTISLAVFHIFFLLLTDTYAQKNSDFSLLLRNGTIIPAKNISDNTVNANNRRSASPGQKSFVVIQFESIPNDPEIELLKHQGIELLDYIPNNAYTATVSGALNTQVLKQAKARAIIDLLPEQKMAPNLLDGTIPVHAEKVKGFVDVWVNFPKSFSVTEINELLLSNKFDIISKKLASQHILEIRVAKARLHELAGQSYIQYVEAIPGPDSETNDKTQTNSRANVLNSNSATGLNLRGNGVVIGVGDQANIWQHIDLSTHVINRSAIKTGSHGAHVLGTVGGRGIMNEKFTGFAPKATIVSQYFSNIFNFASTYVQDYGMMITNNSYGITPGSCYDFGEYNLYSYILDQQAFDMPSLQHVFAAGNSGNTTITCTAGLGTILSGYQVSKNVLTVGNSNVEGVIAANSSRGPVKDGRTKPEITAHGSVITSSTPTNNYGNNSGTSMASAAVTGGMALLYGRYKDTHGGTNPKNGLMKALMVNGATDKGLDGPDYTYGFGWMNLSRSVKMLDNNNYFTDAVNNNATKTHTISVPANTAQLKVMLYWNDPAPSVLTGKNLVNNLDLTVKTPSNATILPRLHNTETPATGVDDINNIEQVVIENPAAGQYTLSVKGKTIPKNSQEYFIVYDAIPVSTEITYPIGDERLVNGDQIYISWDSFGNATSTFKVEYRPNDAASWTVLDAAVAADIRQLLWTVPNVSTDQARVRITQNSTGVVRESLPFTILGVPVISLSAIQCEEYISIDWTSVSGTGIDYEVMMLQGDEMKSVGVTTGNNYTISGLSKDSTYYVTVRARINGHPGRRGLAKSRIPNTGTCQGDISNNDLKIDAIVSPSGSGRKLTSTSFGAATQITIRIKNLDDVPSTQPFEVGFSLGPDGSPVNSQVINPTIPAGGTYDHTFSATANMESLGTYRLKVYVNKSGDNVAANNTIIRTFRHLDNPAVTIPFMDQGESLANQEVLAKQEGLAGGDRYDFNSTTPLGRLRTFVNTGMAYSGSKAFTLDISRYDAAGNTSFLIGTFNLEAYKNSVLDIRLAFRYKNHGQLSNPNNKVWIRGSDTDPWIEAYDLFQNQNESEDGYKLSANIAVSALLKANNQRLSSSFQVRWGQWGDMITADKTSGGGYTFDDIQLLTETGDVALTSIENPAAVSCGLGSNEQIRVKVSNATMQTITLIPIKAQVDNGAIMTAIVESVGPGATVDFTFPQTMNLSAAGKHKIKVWVEKSGDNNSNNNAVELDYYNAPVVAAFPYLQNFETSDGSWHSEGTSSSWAYGTPASSKINRAASGTKAWKTGLSTGYNNQELSYLYSPCLNIGGLSNPTLSFSMALDLEDCDGDACDVAYVEYSTNGNDWLRLGTKGTGTNWYDETIDGQDVWSVQDFTRWHVSTVSLPKGTPTIRLRFVLKTNASNQRDGIAIDDIHIYDLQNTIYSGTTSSQAIAKSPVNGNSWIHFTDNNQILASIQPNNADLGSTSVQAFVNASAVRTANNQYYLDRNFTIKPSNTGIANDVWVRLFFLDSEAEKLITANNCGSCSAPADVYELALSKYHTSNSSLIDGNLYNDTSDGWSFFPATDIAKVPYDKGYYIEFKTRTFSEFWLAKSAITTSNALPVELLSFTAKKKSDQDAGVSVLLEWATASEKNFSHFEIERASSSEEFRRNSFQRLGEIYTKPESATEQRYLFSDDQLIKSTALYYRLKMVDIDNTYRYSPVRAVSFNEKINWNVYPNPSDTGVFYLDSPSSDNKNTAIHVYNPSGQFVRKITYPEHLNMQKMKIDLSSPEINPGAYVLEIVSGAEKQVFKVIRK